MSEWMTTRRQRVEVQLANRRVLLGDIHLQPMAEHHSGPETPIDLLNRVESFFVLILEGEQPIFVSKPQVLFVLVPAETPIVDPDRASAARRFELEIELADGTLLEGQVLTELPPDRVRALDFLNGGPPFFPISAADAVRIVNRNQIRAASPLVDIKRGAS